MLKTFETFTDCHIKTRRSLKRGANLKIPSTVFRTYALSVGFKIKAPRKSVFERRQEPTQGLPKKLLKEATIHFYCLLDEHVFQIKELKELN